MKQPEKNEMVLLSVPMELLDEIRLGETDVMQMSVADEKLIIEKVDSDDYECDGICDGCPFAERECDGNCEHCPCRRCCDSDYGGSCSDSSCGDVCGNCPLFNLMCDGGRDGCPFFDLDCTDERKARKW